jgi:hypothetical protein
MTDAAPSSNILVLSGSGFLGVGLEVVEVPVDTCLRDHPEAAPFLCHRFYDMRGLAASGAAMPRTGLEDGLRAQVVSLLVGV